MTELFDLHSKKDFDKQYKIVKDSFSGYKFDDPIMETNFQKDFDKVIKDLHNEKKAKTTGGVLRNFYSDDFNLKDPRFLRALNRKEPWALKTARSSWAWNTGNVSKANWGTGNNFFDWYLKTVKFDWWLDQVFMFVPNVINVGAYQFAKQKNKGENDKYIAALAYFNGDKSKLKDLSNPEVFAQVANDLVNKKGDKRKKEERLAALYYVANRHGGKSKKDLDFRKDIIYGMNQKTNLVSVMKDNAETIRKAGITDPSVADIMSKYDPVAKKWNFTSEDFLNAKKNIQTLRKVYPYNNPEKYQEKIAQILLDANGDPKKIKKGLNDFLKEHKGIATVAKDKKGKEVKFKPADLEQRSDIEKAMYKNLSSGDLKKFLFNFEFSKYYYDISGKDDAGNESEEIKNKKLWEFYGKVLKDNVGVKDITQIKNLDFGKLKGLGGKLEKEITDKLLADPNMSEEEYKKLEFEMSLKLRTVNSIYSAFGLSDTWKKEKDADSKKELQEAEKEKQTALDGLTAFEKNFSSEQSARREFNKKILDFEKLKYAGSDNKRKVYLEELNKVNQEIRQNLAIIVNPVNKLTKEEDDSFDDKSLDDISKKYKELIDEAENEAKMVKEIADERAKDKPKQNNNKIDDLLTKVDKSRELVKRKYDTLIELTESKTEFLNKDVIKAREIETDATGAPVVDTDGKPKYKVGTDGKPVYQTDTTGNFVYIKKSTLGFEIDKGNLDFAQEQINEQKIQKNKDDKDTAEQDDKDKKDKEKAERQAQINQEKQNIADQQKLEAERKKNIDAEKALADKKKQDQLDILEAKRKQKEIDERKKLRNTLSVMKERTNDKLAKAKDLEDERQQLEDDIANTDGNITKRQANKMQSLEKSFKKITAEMKILDEKRTKLFYEKMARSRGKEKQ